MKTRLGCVFTVAAHRCRERLRASDRAAAEQRRQHRRGGRGLVAAHPRRRLLGTRKSSGATRVLPAAQGFRHENTADGATWSRRTLHLSNLICTVLIDI